MVIFQAPNKPIIVALVAAAVGMFVSGTLHGLISALFYIALIIWAYEELANGVNRFRKGLGGIVLIYILISLGFQLTK